MRTERAWRSRSPQDYTARYLADVCFPDKIGRADLPLRMSANSQEPSFPSAEFFLEKFKKPKRKRVRVRAEELPEEDDHE